MRFLHTMVRIRDEEASLNFYCKNLGLEVVRKKKFPQGRFTLIFLKAQESEAEIELTLNWDTEEELTSGRNFGHLAFQVKNIYETCERLSAAGVKILRPPRDGHMAFIRSPDNISIELLQKGDSLAPQEPWLSMPNSGTW